MMSWTRASANAFALALYRRRFRVCSFECRSVGIRPTDMVETRLSSGYNPYRVTGNHRKP